MSKKYGEFGMSIADKLARYCSGGNVIQKRGEPDDECWSALEDANALLAELRSAHEKIERQMQRRVEELEADVLSLSGKLSCIIREIEFPSWRKCGHAMKDGVRIRAVNGLIAAGKTSALALAAFKGGVLVHVEDIPNEMRALIYQGRDHLAFQLYVLSTREATVREIALSNTPGLHLLDRDVVGDIVFGNANRYLGNIDDQQWAAYCSLVNRAQSRSIASLEEIVHLNADVDRCIVQCAVRGNPTEADIPRTYFELLEELHFYAYVWLLHARLCPVRVVSAAGTVEDAANAILLPFDRNLREEPVVPLPEEPIVPWPEGAPLPVSGTDLHKFVGTIPIRTIRETLCEMETMGRVHGIRFLKI